MNRHIRSSSGRATSSLIALGTLLLMSCADPGRTEEPQVEAPETAPPASREERIELRRRLQSEKNIEQMPRDEATPVSGEVPADLLDKVMADLEQRTGAVRADFDLQRAESRLWNDGSLGCPEPGQDYTQAIVNGFRIVIGHQGQAYDYRASDRGFFKLCPGPTLTR